MSYGGAGSLFPVGGVVLLVGLERLKSGQVVLDGPRVANEPGVLSLRCTAPAFGQGSYAVFWVPSPQDLGGTDCEKKKPTIL